jgi:hypothetical protein
MRVAYISNTRHRHCTENHVGAALKDLGHEVRFLQEDELDPGSLLRRAKGADLLLYTRTWGLTPPNEAIDAFRQLEGLGTVTASFHLDLYLGLVREATLDGDPFWATQFTFTPDGDPASQVEFERRGINHFWSPPAVHLPECIPGQVKPEYASPVCFVGSYPYPHPEWTHRDELVAWAADRYGSDFRRWGAGATTVRNEPLNDVYASTTVVLGDSLCPGFTKPYYWSDRLTETIGRGGFLVWPHIEGTAEIGFEDGVHFREYQFGDFDQLGEIVDHFLAHPDEARAIAEQGQAFVRENHTYRNRMEKLIETIRAGL